MIVYAVQNDEESKIMGEGGLEKEEEKGWEAKEMGQCP